MPQGGIVTTFSDITDRVAAANALARANETLERRVRERTAELMDANKLLEVAKAKADEANLDKTRFLAAASHDLLQPLNAARLYTTSLVERELPGSEGLISRNIDASLSSVEEILGALIDLSRMDAGRIEAELSDVPLKDLFDSVDVEFAHIAREKKIDLRVVRTSAWVRSDRRLLRRVLQNLVANAVKYTRSGKVLVGVRRRGASLVVEVHDTGPGIPSSQHALIFKEFQRLDQSAGEARGLGLGLSIVERIGKVLGTGVEVSSTVGRGSCFRVALPEAQGRVAEPVIAPVSGRAASALAGCRVLCVDNEPTVLAGMQTLLSGWGCEVLTADSAQSALKALNAAQSIPDVLICDYHLDHGTGVDAIETIRKVTGRKLPAVIITADHSPEVQRTLRQMGLLQLRKPLKAAALRAVLTRYVRRGALEAAQ
jgi:signal transduction histidine kinase